MTEVFDRAVVVVGAGELVGGLFFATYPGCTGLTSGSVLGPIAGSRAAAYAAG